MFLFSVKISKPIWGAHILIESFFPMDIPYNFLHPTESVCNLDVWFDSQFTFTRHVENVCKGCFAQLRDLRRAWRHLTTSTSILVANALVSSRLDYCNSFQRSLSKFNLQVIKLKCLQNSAARIVTDISNHCTGCQLINALVSRLPHWCTSSFTLGFPNILVHTFNHIGVVTIPGILVVKVQISLCSLRVCIYVEIGCYKSPIKIRIKRWP